MKSVRPPRATRPRTPLPAALRHGTFRNRNLPRFGNSVTFQSAQSHTPTQSYVADDYFGFPSDVASSG